MPLLNADGPSIQRSGSQSSLLSVQSAESYGSTVNAFSNFTAQAVKLDEQVWEEIAELRRAQARNIDLIKTEVQTMVDSCSIQVNVNMTIKVGLKKIKELVDAIGRDHSSATEKEIHYQKGLAMTEKGRQERRHIQERVQAQVMRNNVLASHEASKRKRPSPEEISSENRLFKKAAPMNASKSSEQTPALKKQKAENATAKSSKDQNMISSVLMKVSQGKTYADVLEKLRKEVNPDASGSRVVSARAMHKGDILILLDKGSNEEGFTAGVRRVVEGRPQKGHPRDPRPRPTRHRGRGESRDKEDPTQRAVEPGGEGLGPKPKGTEARRSGSS